VRPLLVCIALAVACGGSPVPTPPEAVPGQPELAPADQAASESGAAAQGAAALPDAHPALAPYPFTAEQIRDATRQGRTYVYRVERPVNDITMTRMEFVDVGENDAMIRHVRWKEGETPSPPHDGRSTWQDLQGHAAYAADRTTVTEESITVPAGTFECLHYKELPSGTQPGTDVWFAKELPGAPVRLVETLDGVPMVDMQLMEHRAGS
jgi:hypothetical protein